MVEADCGHRTSVASPWVERFLSGVKAGGHVLDVACGTGRHLRLVLAAGLRATGVDRDVARLAEDICDAPGCALIEDDLEDGEPPVFAGRRFDGVIVTNYLWRPLLPAIVAAVASDGILIYETFADGQEKLGRPRNADFLLRPGELIEAVHGALTVVAYEHLELAGPRRRVQRIAAVGPRHGWISDPIC